MLVKKAGGRLLSFCGGYYLGTRSFQRISRNGNEEITGILAVTHQCSWSTGGSDFFFFFLYSSVCEKV